MMTGKSISHVNQGVGTCYSKTEVAGYYNDLTEKVTRDDPNILIPKYHVDTGEEIYFSIGIFQYGLAAYDLFLTTHNEIYKNKLIACANWAVENQQEDGGWDTFTFETPNHPYSSMAQGEGISMLIRAHIITQDERYISAVHKAKDFMIKSIADGGTTNYQGEDVYLYECTHDPLILNGWIFSLWGLFDYSKYIEDSEVQKVFHATLTSLKKKLPEFDIKYWSKYEDGKRICSPFYHKLHIAQLTVMHDLFGDEIYKEYADKWEKYQNSFWNPKVAFIKKAMQKVFE
jgi:hypothetical protein